MRNIFWRFNILLISILLHFYSISQDSNLNKFIRRCSEKFSPEYRIPQKKDVSVNDFFVGKFKANSLKYVDMWLFTSKEIATNNLKKGFTILIYKYSSNNNASIKFKELETVKKTQDDSVFGKGWSHALLQNNLILLLSGDCYYSKEDWGRIVKNFDDEREKIFYNRSETIDCICGGGCL